MSTTTEAIKTFYGQNPFPGYEDIDSPESLRQKARRGIFARLLDEQIPTDAKILEIGCGTGQLSNFLGLSGQRTIFATDISINALKLGAEFADQNGLNNVSFVQMDLFRPVFKTRSFDVVIANGVLHHTANPYLGFKTMASLVKNSGFIVIGLYNRYGRLATHVRRLVFKMFGDNFRFLDPRLRDKNISAARKNIWFLDQYKNPHESTHTIDEVLNWFDRSGFEFINGIPKTVFLEPFNPDQKLFEPQSRGAPFDHLLVQLGMILHGGHEGGLFLMIGRKKS